MENTTGAFNDLLFCEYLQDTKGRVKGDFTTTKWLNLIDLDSIHMLEDYIENFREETKPEDINDNEVEDMISLAKQLATLETAIPTWAKEFPELDVLVEGLCAMVVLEALRRKGMIEFKGDGKLTSKNNCYTLTELGKKVGEQIQDEKKTKGASK